jgi:uncharacterized membrane protein YuzA (DUF378 family)
MHKSEKCGVHCVAWSLLLVGGLNWGLVGLFKWNLVEVLFGSWPWLVSLVYILVGLSAVAMLMKKSCKQCK